MPYCYSCMAELSGNVNTCPKCGSHIPYAPADARDLLPGTLLQRRFVVGRSLGHGGFGITYIAYDTHLKTLRAIKEFFPGKADVRRDGQQNLIINIQQEENVRKYQSRFLREARMMSIASLNHVENVVQIIDQFEEHNTSYIIMEYLDGCTLDEYLNKHLRGAMPWRDAVPIVLTVLNSLSALHQHDLLHRDVSMSNIFRLKNGEIRLIDFGSAGRISFQSKDPEELTRSIKPGYSPYEQIMNLEQGPWTDVYAMAVTLFKMIVGGIPKNSSGGALPPASKAAPDKGIPAWLDAALIKATQQDPSKRYRTADEFARALQRGVVRPSSKRKKFLAALIPAAALALAVMLVPLLSANEGAPDSNKVSASLTSSPTVTSVFYTQPPSAPPTATPLPADWTGNAVYTKGDGDQNNDIYNLQFALKDMGYISLEHCSGTLDDYTIRAVSAFCIENNVDFDAQKLDPLLRYAICSYKNTRMLPDGLTPLTEAHRKLLTPLGALSMDIVPAPNEAGYIGGNTLNIRLDGEASPNQRIEILVNGAQLSWTNSDRDGNWSYNFLPEILMADKQNTVVARYESQPDLQAEDKFIYKPSMQPIALNKIVQDGDTSLNGTTEALAIVTLDIDGIQMGNVTASANGDFSFGGFIARAGNTLTVTATDVAGNQVSIEEHVQEEARAEITMCFQDDPEAHSITTGLSGVMLYGTAHAGRTISLLLNGTEQAFVVPDSQGEWRHELDTETLAHASVNTIAARYADGVGNTTSLALVIDGETVAPVLLNTVDEESTSLIGIAEAGASITLEANGKNFQTTADDTGRFEIDFTPQSAGNALNLTSQDLYGNTSSIKISVQSIEFLPITAEGDNPLLLGPNRLPASLHGTAQPNQKLIFSVSGIEVAKTMVLSNGQWSCDLKLPSDVQEGALECDIAYEREKGTAAKLQIVYDASVKASFPNNLYEDEDVIEGTCEAGAMITAQLSENGSQLGAVKAETDSFSLKLSSPVRAGDEILLTVEDLAGNQLNQAITVQKSLAKYTGGFEFPAEGTSFTSELSVSAWMLCAADVQGRIILEGEGRRQQLPMQPCDETALEQMISECETPVQSAIGWKLATRIKMDDYDLPHGAYTLTLVAIADGKETPVATRQAFYGDESEGAENETKELSYSAVDEEIGYAFGIDAFHWEESFDPKTVVLTGYFYAPEGSTFTMAYSIDGTEYVDSEMKKMLGGKPVVYRSARGSSSISRLLGEESVDMSTATWALSLNLSKLDYGAHTIQLTLFVTLPNAATQIITMKAVTVTTAADGESFSSKVLKNGLNQ